MSSVFGIIGLVIKCGTVLLLAFAVLLAMPKSKLRAVLMQIVGWAVVAFCIVYGISPVDVLPEALLGPLGLIDDLGAIAVAVGAGSMALKAGRELKEDQG
jgi:uncharacterized membrane protein YkvA (DUF1232 family)